MNPPCLVLSSPSLPSPADRLPSRRKRSTCAVALLLAASGIAGAQSGSPSPTIDFSKGFDSANLSLNGSARLNGSRLQLTSNNLYLAGSAYYPTPVSVQQFTTDFTFQLSNAAADGFTFALQTGGPQEIGVNGGDVGFIGQAAPGIAVRFGLYGSNENTVGVYSSSGNGTYSQIGQSTLLGANGINLHNGDPTAAHIQFDGANIIISLTDTVTSGSLVTSYALSDSDKSLFADKPAYVGFTGGTGALTATEEITSWVFTGAGSSLPAVLAPRISFPTITNTANGVTSAPFDILSITADPNATIFYNTTGKPLGVNSPVFDSSRINFPDNGVTYTAVAFLKGPSAPNGIFSPVVSATYGTGTPASNDVIAAKSLVLNGSAVYVGNRLRLTDTSTTYEAGGAWTTPIPSLGPSFTASFDFQITDPAADGFMFVAQSYGTKALGAAGGSLGYAGLGQNSFGIKFDLYDNAGEGVNSTGLYVGGQLPATPSIDLTPSGIDLHSGHVFHVFIQDNEVAYLSVEITDMVTGATARQSYPVSLATVPLEGEVTFGFTGGTGGLTATQDILSFTYTNESSRFSVPFQPAISPAPGSYAGPLPVTFDLGSTPSTSEAVYYTLDGSTPTRKSAQYVAGQPIVLSQNTTVRYIGAVGPTLDNPLSNTTEVFTAVYTITP